MAQLGMHFDPNTVEPNQGFELLPPGEYRVQITESDVRPTKSGTGRIIWTQMEVLDGEFANQKIWHQFNIINDNEKAQNIGQGQLAALCLALGIVGMEDSEELHFKPFVARVGIQKGQNGYQDQNRVNAFKPDAGSGGIRSARPVQPRQGAQSSASGNGSRPQAGSRPGGAQGVSRPWDKGGGRGQQGQQQDPIDDDLIPF